MAKKYDVYGVGNALVDFEFEVSDSFLEKLKIQKGFMTLVDQNRQAEIIESLNNSTHKRTCGGSAANTMIAVAQYGGKSFYSCKVASDETGDFYFKDLMDNGVDTNLSTSSLEAGITGKCLVLVTPDADRTMNTYLGITADFSSKELVEEHIKNSNYIYIEGYLVPNPKAKEACLKAIQIAKANGVKTAFTFSDVNMINYFGDGINEIIGDGMDLLFCNEAEAYAYTKTNDLKDCVAALKKVAKAFAITLGPKGAYVFDGEEDSHIITMAVEAIDSNGAGDLFAGSVLYGINNGMSMAEAAKMGCFASSTLVTQFGARLRNEQITKIKEQF